ncbi:hypothetical protein F4561_002171 [Lipingzhangella halophila]|uniref:Uncharacterized protein n=1 Tax=Lipingzhangella halophila TaxID=1783352 RepID=A0A7W7W243_9ACTN|nr:hypothetical protein [Lipingzhangella halophila]MBB4931351.1 hypothetical protein [Lipingzhangella halophila]
MATATRPAEAGTTDSTTAPAGRLARIGAAFGRGARRARSATGRWFDANTGHRGSTAWRATRGASGFRARRQAARDALRARKNHRPLFTALFAGGAALFAGLGAAVGRARARWHARADAEMNRVMPPEENVEHAHGSAEGERDAAHERASREPSPWRRDQPTTEKTDTDGSKTTPTDNQPNATNPNGNQPNAKPAPTPAGGNSMSGLPMASVAADMNSAASRYAPEDMWAVVRESRQWPEVSNQVALSVRTYAQKLESDYPINQAVTDKLQELYTAIAQTGSIAQEIEPLLRKAHQDDIARKENARRGEEKWNV